MKQENSLPGYSVLMSVYGKEKPEYLRESLRSMEEQTVKPSDFVIVCDGPLGEGLEAVLSEFQEAWGDRVQLVRLPRCGGLGNALNTGLPYCRCERIARMDSDDISMSDRCERQLLAMEREGADLVGGALYEFEDTPDQVTSLRISPCTQEEILAFAGKRNPFNHPCVLYRRGAVEAAGGYRHCPWFEDYDLWARMLLGGSRGYNLQEPVLYMRAGEGMYARRGGWAYACQAVRFRYSLKKRGLSTWKEFIVTAGGQFAVSLLPNGLRRKFYGKVLRREA